MDYVLLALAVVALGLMGRLYAVFLANEEVLVNKLLTLFAVGALVSLCGKTYQVIDLEMGYAMMVCLSTGKLRCVDLMTPVGTYRHGMIHEWTRGEPIADASSAAVLTSAAA